MKEHSNYWTLDQSMRRPLGASDFNRLKRQCRERGELFEDPDFSVCSKTIYIKNKPSVWPFSWKRPHEICSHPKFISSTSHYIEQGLLGTCWLLAATSCIITTRKLMDRVVPPDQSFEENYCGLFRFRFWHFGEWLEIVIDDRLPTYNGKLVYLRSANPTEFWISLLEKAYAKFYGSYELLLQGSMSEVFQDLTGGIVQSFSLTSLDRRLTFRVVNSAVPRSTLLVASVQLDNKRQLRLRNGLLSHHSFTITGLARVRTTLGEVLLVRLHNPWGRGNWNGSWSERSWEWESLSERDKELLSVRGRNENEFWLSFEDFVCSFSNLDLIHVGPDDWLNEPSLQSKKPWRAVLARRRWRIGYNAGGGPKCLETIGVNPQFRLHIPRNVCDKCHVVVSVMQQYQVNKTNCNPKKKCKLVPIGFSVYEVPANVGRIHYQYFKETQPLDVTNHSISRESVTFFTLPSGDYIVLPCTEYQNIEAKFLLRIYTDEQTNTWEINDENVTFRNLLTEDAQIHCRRKLNYGITLNKLSYKYPNEINAQLLLKILRSTWRNCNLLGKPNLELCKSLIVLKDRHICGRIRLDDIPNILYNLHFWQNIFLKFDKTKTGKISSYLLRPLLWEAGVTVSNKVLECLVLRFAKETVITFASFLLVMVRLYLSHDRYRHLKFKLPTNPLTAEEVSKIILMTIYA